MALSGSQKMLLLLVLAFAFLSSPDTEAWSWSWSEGPGYGFGFDGSSSSRSGPGWGFPPSSPGSHSATQMVQDGSSSSGSHSHSKAPRKIIVGGPRGWTKGIYYDEWVYKNGPYYVNDVLVFTYDKSAKQRNNVYILHDISSYLNCQIKNGTEIAPTNKDSEESFEFTLRENRPYLFASGDYCTKYNMKFSLKPKLHRSD